MKPSWAFSWNTTWDSLVGRIDLLLGNDRLGARAFHGLALPAGVPRVIRRKRDTIARDDDETQGYEVLEEGARPVLGLSPGRRARSGSRAAGRSGAAARRAAPRQPRTRSSGVAGSPTAVATAGCTMRPRHTLAPCARAGFRRRVGSRPWPASASA